MQDKWDLKTYCEILGVTENSPQHLIHAAYINARKLYSKENLNNSFSKSEGEALEQLVEEAFAVLGNHSLRAFYQRKNESRVNQPAAPTTLSPVKTDMPDGFKNTTVGTYKVDPKFEDKINNAQFFDGSTLRQIREYKCITIETISRATKIKSTYIKSIEENNLNALPAPVYTRGFIIQIAKTLDLPAEEVASSYMCQYKNTYEPTI